MGAIGRLALVVLVALLTLAGCGGGTSSGGGGDGAMNSGSPQGKAESAGFSGVHGGEIEIALEIDRYKKPKPEEINMRVLGTFAEVGEDASPQFDLAIESRGDLAGREVEFLSGPLWLHDKTVVNFDGKVYGPDQATFGELQSKLEAAQGEGGAGDARACPEAAGDFGAARFLDHLSAEGKGETLDGVPLTMIGADLDVPAAIGELIELAEDPGCAVQLEAVGLPPVSELEALQKQLQKTVISSPVTLGIDKNGVIRTLTVLTNVELPHDEELEVELVIRLNRVNEITEFAASHGYAPFPALLKQFGLTPADIEHASGDEIAAGVLEAVADRMFGRETS